MRKIIIALLICFNTAYSQTGLYILSQDTTVSGTWNLSGKVLKVLPGAKIHGTGTVTNYWMDAYYNQNIFDTTLDFSGILGGVNGKVSAIWFGVSTNNLNNKRYFQRGVDACIGKGTTFYIPQGYYRDSGAFYIRSYDVNGNYQQAQLNIEGDYMENGASPGTVIYDLNKDSCCIGIQYGKGCKISGLALYGKFVPPSSSNPSTYYNLTLDQFRDSTCSAYYSGIATDPLASSNTSGCTQIIIENCLVAGFTNNIFIALNGVALNNELITMRHISFGSCVSCIVSSQSQEKVNVIEYCMAWESCWCFINLGHTRQGAGGYYILSNINIAGACVNPFYVNVSGWFGFSVNHFYAESVASLGTLTTDGAPIQLSDVRVQLKDSATIGAHYFATTNNKAVIWRDCFFTYFDGSNNHQIGFNGVSTFDNCTFGGKYVNQITGSIFYPNCTFRN